ncbi:hypothetical protein CLV92_1101 [Kineococcus xinjiangensis]|uniref:Uncharacterized protein n=2 Tax=Kineococcus xinjiangensis TaxID=512762 RepID=A0A2S6IGN5_9ACTN|nr:hypothetical protein CLV92_1101 [Kineococcus xinjiangensis]
MIQTIAVLECFGTLAAEIFEYRFRDVDALIWLGEHVAVWGRVHAVEALCRIAPEEARPWLLRRSCGGGLDTYFAGKVAVAARLHEAMTDSALDGELIDHTGQLLAVMTRAANTGLTLKHYEHGQTVVRAHVRAATQRPPAAKRHLHAAMIAEYLGDEDALRNTSRDERLRLRGQYIDLLSREDWVAQARQDLAERRFEMSWTVKNLLPGLGLAELY